MTLEEIVLKFNIVEVKKESGLIGILFIVSLIMFKILFYQEEVATIIRVVASFFWLFVIPGFFVMSYWKEKIGFMERFIAGIIVSAAIIGVSSYYMALWGIHAIYHGWIIPALIIIIMSIIYSIKTSEEGS